MLSPQSSSLNSSKILHRERRLNLSTTIQHQTEPSLEEGQVPVFLTAPLQYCKQLSHREELQTHYGSNLREMLSEQLRNIEAEQRQTVKIHQKFQDQERGESERISRVERKQIESSNRVSIRQQKIRTALLEKAKKRREKDSVIRQRLEQLQNQEAVKSYQTNKKLQSQYETMLQTKQARSRSLASPSKLLEGDFEKPQYKIANEEAELRYCLELKLNLQHRLQRGKSLHDKIIQEKIERANIDDSMICVRTNHQRSAENQQKRALQRVGQILEKVYKSDLVKRRAFELKLKKKNEFMQEKYSKIQENIKRLKDLEEQRFIDFHQKMRTVGTPVNAQSSQMSITSRQFENQQRARETSDQIFQQRFNSNDMLLGKIQQYQRTNNLIKESREKLRELRLHARFLQKEAIDGRLTSTNF